MKKTEPAAPVNTENMDISFWAQAILDEVQYLEWKFFVGVDQHGLYLQVQFNSQGRRSGDAVKKKGKVWPFSPDITQKELVYAAIKAVLDVEENEVRENFLYQGQCLFGGDREASGGVKTRQVI